jgi:hypothetical protein
MSKATKSMGLIAVLFCMPALSEQSCNTSNRLASTPTNQFQIKNNGTVTDTKTGLVWKRCSEEKTLEGDICVGTATSYTWQEALQKTQSVNSNGFAGFTDWRVPNVKELMSIVEWQCELPSINLTIFPDDNKESFWSSTAMNGKDSGSLYSSGEKWRVDFAVGTAEWGYPDSKYYIRLVRGGR